MPGTLYVGTKDAGVFTSLDGGNSWNSVSVGLPGYPVRTLAIDPAAHATLYAGIAAYGVFKSINSGQTWTAVNQGLPEYLWVNSLTFDRFNPAILYATATEGLFKTDNGGASWSRASALVFGPPLDCLLIDPTLPRTFYACSRPAGVLKSSDSGRNWRPINLGQSELAWVDALAFDPSSPATLFAATWGGGVFALQDMEQRLYFPFAHNHP